MAGYEVITDALRKEAPKWWGFADKVNPVHRDVTLALLGPSSFFIGDPAEFVATHVHSEVYEGFREFVETVLSQAVTEFDQIGDALVDIADEYDRAEAVIELDLNKAYSRH